MKRILIFSPHALEYGRGGEISTIELASGLKKHYIITLIHTNIRLKEKALSKNTIMDKLGKIDHLERLRFATIRLGNKILTFPYPQDVIQLFKEIKKSDIIYFSISTIKNSLLFIFSSIIYQSKKYIVGYRKPLQTKKLFSIYNLKYRINILILSLFKNKFYHHALSKHAKDYLENFYDREKVIHITHGIDLKRYKNLKTEKNSEILNFLYIGYLDDEHKGVGILLEGIKEFLLENKYLNIFFEFCGKGPLEPELKKLERTFPHFIKFHGYIDNIEIPNYYAKNDIFLFTSRREPFPRTIMEALAGECIILCTKTIGSVELLDNKNFGFFLDNLSPTNIKNSLEEIYHFWKKNPQKIKYLQKKAMKFVKQNYSIQNELNEFKELISYIFKNKNLHTNS